MNNPETQAEVDEIVHAWIENNHDVFYSRDNQLYRRGLFTYLHTHIGAPESYLDYRMNIIPDLTSFYMSILNTIIVSVLLALNIFLLYTIYDVAMKIPGVTVNQLVESIIFLVILIAEFYGFFIRKSRYGASWGMNFIQEKSGLLANFRELEIESYYISTIRRLRSEPKS